MNFSKYSTTNISSSNQLNNFNSSMNYQQNALKRQSSVTKQEQSVERLKSCIADLKKLASNKVKRVGPSNAIDQPPSFGMNAAIYNQEEDSIKQKDRHSTAHSATRPKQKSSNQVNNSTYERKTHQTKIANALKKYISEIEQTTNPSHNGPSKDQRRDSHRHRSASNKKRSSRHQREDSQSKRNEQPLQGSSKRQNSKSNLLSQKKNFENSLRSNKNELNNSHSSKHPRKAQSQERTSAHLQEKDRIYNSSQSNIVKQSTENNLANQKKDQNQVIRSASASNHTHYNQKSSSYNQKKSTDENQPPHSSNNTTQINQKYSHPNGKDRKPFTFNNYILNQEGQNYRSQANVTTTSKVDKSFLNCSDTGIDIRSNKEDDSFVVTQNGNTSTANYYGTKKAYEYKPSEIVRSSSQEVRYPLTSNISHITKQESSHFGVQQNTESQNTSTNTAFGVYQQKLQPREMKELTNTKSSQESKREESKHRSQERKPEIPKKEIGRSLQELAQMTQSTDFSENRIQSLEQRKIMSIQSNNLNPSNINPPFPSSIYSIQNPISQMSVPYCQQTNSISLAQNNMTYGGIGGLMRTHATREDFNIEDLHIQVVLKLQRSKNLLREIEALPSEKEPEYLLDDIDLNSSGKKHYGQSKRRNSNGRKDYIAPQLLVMVNEELICGDGCSRPAISFKKKI